ncbi:TMEM14 family protein [Synechococcus sp. R55.6]|uniref:TMEM14 family protein n=1 Tax=unclassified Synechococcus TaxID=2626047 RepID=UPI0039C293A5
MLTAQITLLVYGALLLVGGAIGYVKGKSSKSLVGGHVLGLELTELGSAVLHNQPFEYRGARSEKGGVRGRNLFSLLSPLHAGQSSAS